MKRSLLPFPSRSFKPSATSNKMISGGTQSGSVQLSLTIGPGSSQCENGQRSQMSRMAAQAAQKRWLTALRSHKPPSNRPEDIDDFLSGYPHVIDDPDANANLKFYRNECCMRPDDMKFEEFIENYEHDHDELEINHGYIQWLFPIREKGLNALSQPLQMHEIKAMVKDRMVLARLLRAYKMMLAFYGIDFNRGYLRLNNQYVEGLHNLYTHPHNLLRITRILKCISEFPPLQPHAPILIMFFTALHSEGLIDLSPAPHRNMHGRSLDQWWSNCIRDDDVRKSVREIVRDRGRCGGKKWGLERFDEWYSGCRKGWTGGMSQSLDLEKP